MKRPLIFLLVLLSQQQSARSEDTARGGGFGPKFLPDNRPAPVADAMTDEQLLARQAAAKFGGIAPEDQRTRTYDLASNSTFLQNGERFTLVPKGAVLQVPEKLASWVVKAPAGKFQPWPEFQAERRGQVVPFEVTMDQAAGKVPLDPGKLAAAKKAGGLLVAVCRGGPISVVKP